jgi:hypothetical protein
LVIHCEEPGPVARSPYFAWILSQKTTCSGSLRSSYFLDTKDMVDLQRGVALI